MTLNARFYETIARYYDAENATMTEDLALYRELADERGGPVLDVGCGSGRVMLALAQDGVRVVGVDFSAAMLARGRRRLAQQPALASRVTFVEGDALAAELPGPFALILLPYNMLMHFNTQADQLAALRRFRALLAPEGLLVLDLPNAGEAYGAQDDDVLSLERTFIEPESGNRVMQQSVSRLERVSQQFHVTWIYDEIQPDGTLRRTLAPLLLRHVFPAELDLLLALAGLARVTAYGDYDQSPFEEGSPRLIVLAEPAEARA